MSEACDLAAVELRRLIGARKLSPVELLASCRRRIDRVNPALNAVVTWDERAEATARAAEQAVMRGEPLGLLHGLPLGIKDLNETKDLRTTHGSLIYKDRVPAADDMVVARLRAAGGMIVAKTNTPEFGAGANTTNKVFGATGNPFDPALTCAGSSGGSAVALATSMLPLCNGSDLGGSLRTPASFCGVVGLRPTPGRVPADRTTHYGHLSVEGPMARSVADVALLFAAEVAADQRDPVSLPERGRRRAEKGLAGVRPADLSTLKVAFSDTLGGAAPVARALRETFGRRMTKIAPFFGRAEERHPPLRDATPIFEVLRAVGFVASHHEAHYAKHRDKLGPNVIANVEAGLKLRVEQIAAAQVANVQLYRRFLAFMEDVDLLICPVASVSPFDKTKWFPTEIDGEPLATYISWIAITYALTLTGHPVLVIPCGLDPAGLPFGLQLVGKRWGEAELLSAGLALEAALADLADCRRPQPDLGALSG
jgi:Asp-tRNA(Asn)/Glu-tRNA(Gln) amidotransferase A subunit family amidase